MPNNNPLKLDNSKRRPVPNFARPGAHPDSGIASLFSTLLYSQGYVINSFHSFPTDTLLSCPYLDHLSLPQNSKFPHPVTRPIPVSRESCLYPDLTCPVIEQSTSPRSRTSDLCTRTTMGDCNETSRMQVRLMTMIVCNCKCKNTHDCVRRGSRFGRPFPPV